MVISEVISKLSEIKNNFGDIEVVLWEYLTPGLLGTRYVTIDNNFFKVVKEDVDILLID